MTVNTKNRTTRYHSKEHHRSYGIQSWLCGKGFILAKGAKYRVDKDLYKELLKEFCLYDNPEFDFSKVKNMISYEKYVENRFHKFCTFVCNKFK